MAVLFISTYVVLKVLYGRALANFLEPREGRLMFGSLKAYLSLRELSSRKAQREAEKALARYRELKQKAVESAKRVFTGGSHREGEAARPPLAGSNARGVRRNREEGVRARGQNRTKRRAGGSLK